MDIFQQIANQDLLPVLAQATFSEEVYAKWISHPESKNQSTWFFDSLEKGHVYTSSGRRNCILYFDRYEFSPELGWVLVKEESQR
jgi:hypothetical protein